MPGPGLHSVWGCVVDPYTEHPQLREVERSYRVTSASLQSFHSHTTPRIAIYLTRHNDDKPLQIALLSVEDNNASLDLVFKKGDKIAFNKKCILGTCDAEVQLMGHYLDDPCLGEEVGGKKVVVLPAEKDAVTIVEGFNTIYVDDTMEIQIKKRETMVNDKMKAEMKELEEELHHCHQTIEKLYSQIEDLEVQIKNLEEGQK